MSPWTLICRNLVYHARGHSGVFVGGGVATAVLAAALLTGDSVRHSLERQLRWRLGEIEWIAVRPRGRFRATLANDLRRELRCPVAATLQVRGVAIHSHSQRIARHVLVLGVDSHWLELAPRASMTTSSPSGAVAWVNAKLAAELGLREGDELVLRVPRQVALPSDVPLAADATAWGLARVPVERILQAEDFGRFCVEPEPDSPPLIVVGRETLARIIGAEAGRANLLLIGRPGAGPSRSQAEVIEALYRCWDLADWDLAVDSLANGGAQLSSSQVFIPSDVVEVVRRRSDAQVVLTYLVNALKVGERSVPYCFVAGLEAPEGIARLAPNEIVLHAEAAEDLSARVGDLLRMEYFVLDSFQRLMETSAVFRVAAVVPFEGWARDPDLMPRIPGLSGAQSCRDWRPALPLDLQRVRPRDEEYWSRWRGAPRAFVSLTTATMLWSNRFGNATAIRWVDTAADTVVARVRADLAAAALGWQVRNVRDEGVRALEAGPDFRGLFLGLGMFMLAAALILETLMFSLAAAARQGEWRLLHSIGFETRTIRTWYAAELAIVAAASAVLGAGLGMGGAHALVHGLQTVWKDAIGDAPVLSTHWGLGAIASAMALGWVCALVPVLSVSTRSLRTLGENLQVRAAFAHKFARRRCVAELCAWTLALLFAAYLALGKGAWSWTRTMWTPLLAGTMVLAAGWRGLRCLAWLIAETRDARTPRPRITGWSQLWRNPRRTLAAIVMPACGWFMVGIVDVHRGRVPDTSSPDSPGGGFSFYGECTLALPDDPSTVAGRQKLGLDDAMLHGAELLALRRFGGADASCRNPQRVGQPPILGVPVELFDQWNVFAWAQRPRHNPTRPWLALEAAHRPGEIPAILDASVARWNLRVRVGEYLTVFDESGRPLQLRVIGLLQDSIFQGHVLVSQRLLAQHFPSAGRHVLLIRGGSPEVAQYVLDRLENYGIALMTPRERLERFLAVQNGYLDIFYWFSAWGLWLGVLGLGSLAYRNIVERRREIAMLHAVGWELGRLRWGVWREQAAMAFTGWVLGWLAVITAAGTSTASPWRSVLLVGSGLASVALVSVTIGTWAALQGLGPQDLRNE